jgi:hypothetical protein
MDLQSRIPARALAATIIGAVTFGVAAVSIADIVSLGSAVASSSNLTITQLSIAKPADVAEGDLMLATIALHDGSATSVTPPSGWALVLRTDKETDVGIATYYKVAGASEPASYMWTLSPQTRAQGGITRYGGVSATNPINAAAGNTGRGQSATTSSVTTTVDAAEVVAIYALHNGGNNHAGDWFSTPTGMTEKYDASYTAAGPTIATFDAIQATAGATGSKSSDISGSQQRDWAAQLIALNSQNPLAVGLEHYWKFDEASGDAFDSVGTMTLTNNNATPFVAAKIQNGGDFERDSVNFFRTTTDLTATPLTAYSMCLWLKPEVTPAEEVAYSLWTSYDSSGSFDLLYFNPGDEPLQLLYRHLLTPQSGIEMKHHTTLDLEEFSHLCITWDGSSASMYLNASVVGTIAAGSISTIDTFGTTIGAQSVNNLNDTDGIIDEVGFWSRALSSSEINELYNSGGGNQYPF